MIENFQYNDIILYAKGWFYRNDNMIDDLGYLFSKIYGWTPKTEKEIAPMMLKVLDRLDTEMGRLHPLYDFYSDIQRNMCLYDVSLDLATILYVRSILQGLPKDVIKLNPPHYGKKEYFRMGSLFGKYPISQTYTEMNRMAQKTFNN
jgi:hypothetical protein